MAGGYAGEEACHAGAMSSVSRLCVQRCPHLGLFRTAPHRHQNPLPLPLYTYEGLGRERRRAIRVVGWWCIHSRPSPPSGPADARHALGKWAGNRAALAHFLPSTIPPVLDYAQRRELVAGHEIVLGRLYATLVAGERFSSSLRWRYPRRALHGWPPNAQRNKRHSLRHARRQSSQNQASCGRL